MLTRTAVSPALIRVVRRARAVYLSRTLGNEADDEWAYKEHQDVSFEEENEEVFLSMEEDEDDYEDEDDNDPNAHVGIRIHVHVRRHIHTEGVCLCYVCCFVV